MARYDLSDKVYAQQNRATGLPEHLKRRAASETQYEQAVEAARNFRSDTGMPTRYVAPPVSFNMVSYRLGGNGLQLKPGGK